MKLETLKNGKFEVLSLSKLQNVNGGAQYEETNMVSPNGFDNIRDRREWLTNSNGGRYLSLCRDKYVDGRWEYWYTSAAY